MTKFVNDRAKDPDTNKYMFGAQGMVAQLPARIGSHIDTTVTISEDPFVILKSSAGGSTNTAAMLNQVFRAFDKSTWYSLVGVFLFLVFLSAIVSYVINNSMRPTAIVDTMRGVPPDDDDHDKLIASKRRTLRHTIISIVGSAGGIVFILGKLLT